MYIGDKLVNSAPIEGLGVDEMVTVQYDDGTSQVLTQRMFEAMKTETPLDATALRDKYCQQIAGDLLKVLLDWDIVWRDYEAIDTLVRTSLQEHIRTAEEKLWAKPKDLVRLSDINKAKGITW